MNGDLLIHPLTRRTLEALLVSPPHALLLTGPAGMGKLTLAKAWAASLTGPHLAVRNAPEVGEPDCLPSKETGFSGNESPKTQARAKLEIGKNASLRVIAPEENGSIGIDSIRSLYQASRSKSAGSEVIIVDQAETMGPEAQNAFLKLLEEPRPNLVFVLCSASRATLLPTIMSRTQAVAVLRPSNQDIELFMRQHGLPVNPQLLFVADGRPGVLLSPPDVQNRVLAVAQRAKQLLSAGTYQRLTAISELSADRTRAVEVLEAMQRIAQFRLADSSLPAAQLSPWLRRAQLLDRTLQDLSRNCGVKIHLLKLMTGL